MAGNNKKYNVNTNTYTDDGLEVDFGHMLSLLLEGAYSQAEVSYIFQCLNGDAVSSLFSNQNFFFSDCYPSNLPSVRNAHFQMAALQACGVSNQKLQYLH